MTTLRATSDGPARESRTAAPRRCPARRALRARPRRRRRTHYGAASQTATATGSTSRCPARSGAVHHPQGLDRDRRHQPDGRVAHGRDASACRSCRSRSQHTSLREARAGDAVNLEADVIGKYVARLLAALATSHASRHRMTRRSPDQAPPAKPQVAVRVRRRGRRRHSRRPDDHRRRRRGSRERRRSDDGRVEGHARGGQLHGEARPRARLPGDDAGAARPARHSARGVRQLVAARNGDVRVDRRARPARRPASRPPIARRRFRSAIDPTTKPRDLARPGHVFPLRARDGRRARAGRTYRSGGRSGAHRRPAAGRRDLRGHERRRHDGARAGADEVRAASTDC